MNKQEKRNDLLALNLYVKVPVPGPLPKIKKEVKKETKPKKTKEQCQRKEFEKMYTSVCNAYFRDHNLPEVLAKMRFDKYGYPDDFYSKK